MFSDFFLTPEIRDFETESSSLPIPPLVINHSSPRASYCRIRPPYTSWAIRSSIGTRSTMPAARMRSIDLWTRARESSHLSARASSVTALLLDNSSSSRLRDNLSPDLARSPLSPRSRTSASNQSSPSAMTPGSATSMRKAFSSSLEATILSSDSEMTSASLDRRRSRIARAWTETSSIAALTEPPLRTCMCQRPSVSAASSPDSLSLTSW